MNKEFIQVLDYITCTPFKTQEDLRRAVALWRSDYPMAKVPSADINPEQGITIPEFINWYDNQCGLGDVGEAGGMLCLVGKVRKDTAEIIARLTDDGISRANETIPVEHIRKAGEESRRIMGTELLGAGLQIDLNTCTLGKRFIPSPLDMVAFASVETSGVGVVRNIDSDTGRVDFFCYHTDNPDTTGYSMDERGVASISSFIFEKLGNGGGKRVMAGNAAYMRQKLNAELSKHGKVWNDRLHRIEPAKGARAKEGERYYYFNDKLEILDERENGKLACNSRFRAGNYFTSQEEALEYVGMIAEMLRDRLAK